MIQFRSRVARWHALVSMGLILVFTLGLGVSVFVNLKRSERAVLRELIVNVESQLPSDSRTGVNLDDLQTSLRTLVDSDFRRLDYAVYDANGEIVLRGQQVPDELLEKGRDWHGGGRAWISHETYKVWVFYRAKEVGEFRIIASSTRQFDFIDHMLIALIVVLPLTFIIAAVAANAVARKTLAPIEAIETAADKIDGGNIGARIDTVAADLEMTTLIDSLNATFDRQEKNIERIEQFSADAAHQLKTPLAAMRANFELCLRKERQPDEYRDAIGAALEEVQALHKLVEALLLIQRPSNDPELKSQFVDLNLHETLSRSVELLEPVSELRDVGLQLCCDDQFVVSGIDVLLPHLWHNLIHNAIKFSPPGGTVKIEVKEGANNWIDVRVSDEGPGVDSNGVERLFERFYQAEGGSGEGSGLGLAVAKWIVDLHDGSIAVDPECLSAFVVGLPKK